MDYSIDDIKRDVRIIIGENENIEPFLNVEEGDPEDVCNVANERDILTGKMINTAIDNVHSIASREMLNDVIQTISTHTDYDQYGGYSTMILPNDFMRFIMLSDESWEVPVTDTISLESEAYKQLHSRFEGIRASIELPAAVVRTDGYRLTVEAYPTLVYPTLQYVAQSKQKDNGTVTVARLCYKAVLYLIASLYYISIKEDESARRMELQCRAMLGLTENESS